MSPRATSAGAASRRPPALGQAHPRDRAAWRAWLAEHHAALPGVWLVYTKGAAAAGGLTYAEAVEEALCFGWIDSTVRGLDAERYVQLFTPRKPTSTWSRVNKARVADLEARGLMAPAGLAAVAVARRNGSWSSLDAVEALEVPPDLAAALAADPAAERHFAAFAPSARKGYLHWISQARRPETRAARIAEVAALAARNVKSRHPTS